MIENVFRDLALNGFSIYQNINGKFVLKKQASLYNPMVIEETEYLSADDAFDAALAILKSPKLIWSIIVCYNRGLGIEYKNLPNLVEASDKDEAKLIAESIVKKTFDSDAKIHEIKVKLKNDLQV